MCYRSTLPKTLRAVYYPLPSLGAIYSPKVVVFRHSLVPVNSPISVHYSPSGNHAATATHQPHALMDLNKSHDLPLVSVLSVAAVRDPELRVSVSSSSYAFL